MKSHFIIKIISFNESESKIESFYSDKTFNNISIYNIHNPKIEFLLNNRGVLFSKGIEICILVYNLYDIDSIYFLYSLPSDAKYLVKEKEENIYFKIIKNGFNFNNFKGIYQSFHLPNIDHDDDNLYNHDYAFLYINIKPNQYFETNIYPEKIQPSIELSNYYLDVENEYSVSIDTDILIAMDFYGSRSRSVEIEGNYSIGNLEASPNNYYEIFKKEEKILKIKSNDIIKIYFAKLLNNNIIKLNYTDEFESL